MISTGFIKDTYAASRILNFCTGQSSFINVHYSRKIFDHVENSNGFIYNTMMRAYLQTNNPKETFFLYALMLKNKNKVYPDSYTYPIVVQACIARYSILEGKEIHDHVVKMGFDSDVYVRNTLINMYAVCDNMMDARKVFDESPVIDSVSWNSILAGYVHMGNVEEAKLIFDQMPEKNIIASNSMIVLFGRCGLIAEAYRLFVDMNEKDLVSWTALISCYEQTGMYQEALVLFIEMYERGIKIDEVVVISVLSACAHSSIVKTGASVHGLVLTRGTESYVNIQNALIHMYSTCGDIVAAEKLFNSSSHIDIISWNSMISGYAKCGLLKKAREVFDSMPEKDVVSWSGLISGHAQIGLFDDTVALFHEMMLHGNVKPDETILVSVISACTHIASLEQGTWVHTYIKRKDLEVNIILGTTLIDMYMKLGCVKSAEEVFYTMEKKGVSSWNALILGLAMNGQVEKSLEMFSEMKSFGVVPNEITFVAVLGACRHMGLVREGRRHFDCMINVHNIEPNIKHYGCMVDLLGRAGLLKEAEQLIDSMPMAPDVATWGALLGACKKHGANDVGERVGRKLIELQPNHDGFHVLLSNIYASKGSWDNVAEIRGTMIQQGVVKMPGCSIMEANGVVHEFLAGDKAHPQIHEIEEMLDTITQRVKMLGYSPDMNEVSFDVDDEEKETTLFRHSEKLAIAFGLIAIDPPNPIRIMKNLRICNDCHALAKLISKAFNREIVVRDRHRFHHFRQGSCSCMEYW
ncbi:Pentatricopeptide repeat-containing protein [Cynara cardunculus var. scolymus]|uniref:Pentatricopeptide repeat-containing protein n=2 Tax=Cynara cardunculus var. scolymus TaxID=59895 RepID=A0A103Y873_CYNCS|nr:Pentatricopeptide repeat-containing protein [Cynara cardunculus var. scolymus]